MLPKQNTQLSEFMRYLAETNCEEGCERVPSLVELSRILGISVASLREQMEVAKALGLVEARPRTGIRRLPYSFKPAVVHSLNYAVTINPESFTHYSNLRSHIETAYWHQAVNLLTEQDQNYLRGLISQALQKLHGQPIQIPHSEHRSLHLGIYKRLDNPFVMGLLEAFWEVYEVFGLDVYSDLAYHERVWDYHARMVEAICNRNFNDGFDALIEHMELIYQREKKPVIQAFE